MQKDSRRRVTLPPTLGIKPGDALNLEVLEDDRIILIPVEPIPRHQLWAWTTETKEAVTASLTDLRPSIEANPLNRLTPSPRGGPVRIEIRPAFDEALMAAELPVRKAAAKMLLLLQSKTLQQLWDHQA